MAHVFRMVSISHWGMFETLVPYAQPEPDYRLLTLGQTVRDGGQQARCQGVSATESFKVY
jgi:hypothetical protein